MKRILKQYIPKNEFDLDKYRVSILKGALNLISTEKEIFPWNFLFFYFITGSGHFYPFRIHKFLKCLLSLPFSLLGIYVLRFLNVFPFDLRSIIVFVIDLISNPFFFFHSLFYLTPEQLFIVVLLKNFISADCILIRYFSSSTRVSFPIELLVLLLP